MDLTRAIQDAMYWCARLPAGASISTIDYWRSGDIDDWYWRATATIDSAARSLSKKEVAETQQRNADRVINTALQKAQEDDGEVRYRVDPTPTKEDE